MAPSPNQVGDPNGKPAFCYETNISWGIYLLRAHSARPFRTGGGRLFLHERLTNRECCRDVHYMESLLALNLHFPDHIKRRLVFSTRQLQLATRVRHGIATAGSRRRDFIVQRSAKVNFYQNEHTLPCRHLVAYVNRRIKYFPRIFEIFLCESSNRDQDDDGAECRVVVTFRTRKSNFMSSEIELHQVKLVTSQPKLISSFPKLNTLAPCPHQPLPHHLLRQPPSRSRHALLLALSEAWLPRRCATQLMSSGFR